MARGVGGTVRRHTKHNSPVPWTGGELDRQRISGYSTSGASDSLEIPVTPLWALATMESTVAVQTKGLGFSFHAARNSSIACLSSGTLPKESRRILLLVSSPNQRSTRLSQLELVGTK